MTPEEKLMTAILNAVEEYQRYIHSMHIKRGMAEAKRRKANANGNKNTQPGV